MTAQEVFQAITMYLPLVFVAMLMLFMLLRFIDMIKDRWEMWDTQPKQNKLVLLVTFSDGSHLAHHVDSTSQAQRMLNRFIWAGVSEAVVLLDGFIKYHVNDEGLLIYKE